MSRFTILLGGGVMAFALTAFSAEGELKLLPDPAAKFQFQEFVGRRIKANTENWLIPAPASNPGMLQMFHVRDREPVPNIVPWAGEFVGKYLISGVQAMRMDDNPDLRKTLAEVVSRLIASQAADGYLGPFRKHERLLGHWDLWGHYHCMLGLLMWHEATGDTQALDAARKVADLVCNTFLDTGKRALDAQSDEMNLAIIHSLGWLYRITEEPSYFRMMREIEKDWEKAGDYLRSGLNSVEFFQTPRPRWESLHNIQGLVELYRITRETKYKEAFEQQWRSIARWDLRNTGGFSSGEQATGNPYANTAIETCCSIAWMALSVDMLALGGDPKVADLLELATFNAWAGAQHPSGRWCTYSTPMDGAREASAHSIVFQSRPGAAELNCCSVNGPRGWGMLSEWAVMKKQEGLALNWFGPSHITTTLDGGSTARLEIEGSYPVGSDVIVTVQPKSETQFALALRIPGWSKTNEIKLNGWPIKDEVHPGNYLTLKRVWKPGDRIQMRFDQALRFASGDKEALGKISVYRGPLLLAFDQAFNSSDPHHISPLALESLPAAKVVQPEKSLPAELQPLLLLEVPGSNGPVVLCDFASAGAGGTHYRSWLPSASALPPAVVTRTPADGKSIPRGRVLFSWTGPRRGMTYDLEIATDESFQTPLLKRTGLTERNTLLDVGEQFEANRRYYWKVTTHANGASVQSVKPAAGFRVDPNLPPASDTLPAKLITGSSGELVSANLRGDPAPQFGKWQQSSSWISVQGPGDTAAVALNGKDQKLLYKIASWPEEAYSVHLKFRVTEFPENRTGQIFSGWAGPMDDPLRLCLVGDRLFARIEAGGGYSTSGVPVERNRWYNLVAIKQGSRLTLFLDGKERASTTVPEFIQTKAVDFALGGNPHYSGHEHLAVELQNLLFYPDAVPPSAQPQH